MAKTTTAPVIDKSPESVQRTLNDAQAVLDQTAAEGNKAFKGSSFETAVTKKNAGIVTSSEAENRVKSANETLAGITTPTTETESPLTSLTKRLSTLQAELVKTQASEKAAKDAAAGVDATSALKKTKSSEEVATEGKADLNAAATAINGDGTTENIQDPVIRALADKTIANVGIINNQMQTLAQYRQQFSEYTQQDIDSISRTAERSVNTQIAENQRTADAMRFAGVVGGRAQFAPTVEQTIIHEVIQAGLDKVEVINEKKNTAIREARKAEATFDIDAFEKQANLAKEYNNEIEKTISDMNTQVRQAEKDQRESIDFRNAQEERNALIVAEQLVNATPAQIQAAAAENGISIGLLSKAVSDAKFTAEDRAFTTKDNALSLQAKQASINATNRSNQPSGDSTSATIGDFSKTDSAVLRANGLENASLADQRLFVSGGVDDRRKILEKYTGGFKTFEQYLNEVQNEGGMSVKPDSSLYQSIKDQYAEDYPADGAKTTPAMSNTDIASYLGKKDTDPVVAKAKTLADAMAADGKTKSDILEAIQKLTAR